MDAEPKTAVVKEIIGRTGSRGAITQVKVQFVDDPNRFLIRNVMGPVIVVVVGASVIIVVGASVIIVVAASVIVAVVGASVFVVGIFVVIALVDGADVDSFVVKAVVGGMTQFPSSNE